MGAGEQVRGALWSALLMCAAFSVQAASAPTDSPFLGARGGGGVDDLGPTRPGIVTPTSHRSKTVPSLHQRAGSLGDPNAGVTLDKGGRVTRAWGRFGIVSEDSQSVIDFIVKRWGSLGYSQFAKLRVVEDVWDDYGSRHVRMTRAALGLPVEFDQIRVHLSPKNQVEVIEVALSDLASFEHTGIYIDPWTAKERALGGFRGPLVEPLRTDLVVVGSSFLPGPARMAYRVRVHYGRSNAAPYNRTVYIDAKTGAEIANLTNVFSGGEFDSKVQSVNLFEDWVSLEVTSVPEENSTIMVNNVSIQSGQVVTLDMSLDGIIYSLYGENGVFEDRTAVTAHDFIARALGVFRDELEWENWNFDDPQSTSGGTLFSMVHYGEDYDNAFFQTTVNNGETYAMMAFGDGDGYLFSEFARCDDVIGHELGHGVVQQTAGLVYQFESGALNEHYADMLGWFVDKEDVMIGEDCVREGFGAEALRDLCAPAVGGQPGHMNDFVVSENTEDGDWGGVHINSGIVNRAGCLAQRSLGFPALGAVWMQTLRYHLGTTSVFSEMAEGTLTSCEELGYSSSDCRDLGTAWAAVGLMTESSSDICPPHSHPNGDGFCVCDDGYEVNSAGTGCESLPNVYCPPNSTVHNGQCYCDEGYGVNEAGDGCVPANLGQCPSNSHREGGACVCDPCYQGNPQGSGGGCDYQVGCLECGLLQTESGGECACKSGVGEVCGERSLDYSYCFNNTTWVDSDGDGCSVYEANPQNCDTAAAWTNSDGVDATMACCVCDEAGELLNHEAGRWCCQPGDPCGWGEDGQCQCFGECGFDATDCSGEEETSASDELVCGGALAGECGNETWYGRCNGETLVFCDNREGEEWQVVRHFDCASGGMTCGLESEVDGYNCVESVDECGGVPPTGECKDNVAGYCDGGAVVLVPCGEEPCVAFFEEGVEYHYCDPCTDHSTMQSDLSTQTSGCVCDDGFVASEDGQACVSDSFELGACSEVEGEGLWAGDGYCDGVNNNPECGYDGGDCCEGTCVSGAYVCGEHGYACLDPGGDGGGCSSALDACGVCGGDGSTCVDCAGVANGASFFDACGVCGGDGSTCVDCAGVANGDALSDRCDECDSDPSNDCTQDCLGVWGGLAMNDQCGVCNGDNMACADCAGAPLGSALKDNCGVCDTEPSNDCVKDCAGAWGGDSLVDVCGVCGGDGTTCLDCEGTANGDVVLDSCGVCGGDGEGCLDCAGTLNGSFTQDECGTCDSDPANDCVVDCRGEWGGETVVDGCGVCGGDDSSCADCAGVPNGPATRDECQVCDVDPSNDCVVDCRGEWGGQTALDSCGVCGGDGSSCADCAGVVNGGSVVDACGVCGGDDSSCSDCAGVANGASVLDSCGVCGGDDSSCSDCAGVINGASVLDSCGVCGGEGPSSWYGDNDGDGLGDPGNRVEGCDAPQRYVQNSDDLEPDCATNDTDRCGRCAGDNSSCEPSLQSSTESGWFGCAATKGQQPPWLWGLMMLSFFLFRRRAESRC